MILLPEMTEFYQLNPTKYTTKALLQRTNDHCIIFRHGHIAITGYRMGDNREFEKALSVYDEVRWKYELKGGYYVPELREFRVNRAFNPELLAKYFKGYQIKVENDAYPADKVDIKLLAPPKDDLQRVGITFMCSQGEYKRNARYTQQLIDADTGSGKTYLGAAASCFFSARTLVIVPLTILVEQWKASYMDFTSITEDEILVVQGSGTCKKIMDGKYKHKKIFIMLADTISSFNKRYGDLETIELLRSMNVYLKIVDEIHKEMKLISMIEALSNFHMNLYMSATPGRAASKENWIFKSCFWNIPHFGAKFKVQEEKHINIMVKTYRFVPDPKQIKQMVNQRKGWLNSKAYESVLLSAPQYQSEDFLNSLKGMIKWAKGLLKDGNKILILSETIDGTACMQAIAEEFFPGKTSRYYGTMKPAEKKKGKDGTVICATTTSFGTGADVPGIQFVINITTYANSIAASQLPGRARALKDGTQTWYIELVNMSYKKTIKQYEKRKPFLLKKSKTGKIMVVT